MATETVKLPSGLEVRIRRPGLKSIADARKYGAQQGGDDQELRELYSLAYLCSVAAEDPQLSLEREPGKTWIDDLSPADVLHLGRTVMEFTGLDRLGEDVGPLSETET